MEEVALIVLGLVVGSFLNVCIYRLPLDKSIVKPGSHCPSCNTPVKFYDNIPVLSYIILGGKCRHCKTRISLLYPAIELLTGISFWLAYVYFGGSWLHTGLTILFLCLLIVLAIIDLQHMILPLELTIGGAVVFMAYAFFSDPAIHITPLMSIATGAGSAAAFALIYVFYIKVRKIEGLGQGDIWMMLMLGAFLGVHKVVIAILLASLSGLVVGIFFIIFKKKNLKMQLPFGTFLSLGSYLSLFWGNDVMQFIQNLHK